MYRISLKIEIFKEGDVYVALCPELNVSSFGESVDSAKRSVREAIRAFLEECEKMGTFISQLVPSQLVPSPLTMRPDTSRPAD